MSKLSISGSPSGTATFNIVAPATDTSRTITLPDSSGQVSVLDLRTAVTASGTAIDFLNIPATARRVTVMFSGVSTNGTSHVQVQIGASGAVEITGYSANSSTVFGTNTCQIASSTSGFLMNVANASSLRNGFVNLVNLSGNNWVASHTISESLGGSTYGGGSKTLNATLDRIRITTVNGTDVFDAGTINIMVE